MADKKQKRIQVVHPDGRTGTVPESQLDKALAAGFKRRLTVRTLEEEAEAAPFAELLRKASKLTGEFGVPIAGAIAGAERGRRLLAPLGPRGQAGGAIIGAGLGAFGGSLTGEASLGRKPSIQRASEFGTVTALGEAIPAAATLIRPAVGAGLSGATRTATEAGELGVGVTRAQRTQGAAVSSIENILRRALFGAKSRFLAFDKGVNRGLRRAADDIAKSLSDLPDDVARSKFLQDALDAVEKRAGDIISQGKSKLFEKIGNQQVILKRSEILPLLRQLRRGLGSLKGRETFGTAQDVIQEVLNRFDAGRLSVREADTIISQIFDLTSSGQVTIGKGSLKQLSKELFNGIERAATSSKATKEFAEFSVARSNFRFVKETLENKLVDSLVKLKSPELLGRLMARPGIGSRIGNLNQILSKKEINAARRSFFEFLVDKTTIRNLQDISEGAVSGDKFIAMLDDVGDDVLKRIFEPEQLAAIKKFARVANVANLSPDITRPISGQSVSLLSFAQGAQLSAFVGGVATGAFIDAPTGALIAGGALISPAVVARLLANPKGIDLLTKLSRFPASSFIRETSEIVLKLNNLLAVEKGRKLRLQRIPTTPIPSTIP